MLIDVDQLLRAYYEEHPDPVNPAQAVSFGTSGHRGTSLEGTFTEDHIVAISAAIAEYRADQDITGPLYIGRDTHALSEPAFRTAVEVLVAHGVRVASAGAHGQVMIVQSFERERAGRGYHRFLFRIVPLTLARGNGFPAGTLSG